MSPSEEEWNRQDLARYRRIQDSIRDGHLDRAVREISPEASLHYLRLRDAGARRDSAAGEAQVHLVESKRQLIAQITACPLLSLAMKLRLLAAAHAVDATQPGASVPLVEISRELEPFM